MYTIALYFVEVSSPTTGMHANFLDLLQEACLVKCLIKNLFIGVLNFLFQSSVHLGKIIGWWVEVICSVMDYCMQPKAVAMVTVLRTHA